MTVRSGRGSRHVLLGALSLVFGAGLALLLAEGLVRLLFDEPVQPRFFVDSGYGVRGVQAGIDTRHYVPGEYDVRVRTNSAGMRGVREYTLDPQPGVHRVLMLGDSFVFGFGVEDDEVVSAVLEDRLNAASAPGQRFEVINLAVSGFGQAEELVTLRARGLRYRPQTVVLFYFDNDIGNNAVARLFEPIGEEGVRPTGNVYLPGVKTQEWLYAIAPVRWLFEHSQAWNLIRNRLSSLVQASLLRQEGLREFDDLDPESVALTRALLRELVKEAAAAGARSIVVIIPHRKNRSNFPMTAQEVAAMGAQLMDGREFLTPQDFYRRDGHWRAAGHRKVAERLAALILSAPATAGQSPGSPRR